MLKSSAIHSIGAEGIQHRNAIFDKTGIRIGINSQSRQCHHYLSIGFAGAIVAVCALGTGQPVNGCIHFRLVSLIIRCQCGQCHSGHIRQGITDGPAAVILLCIQNLRNQGISGNANRSITMGIQCNQRPDGTIDPLGFDVLHVIQTRQQVDTANIGYVLADGCQSQDHPGIFCGLFCMQPVILNLLICQHQLQCVLDTCIILAGYILAASGQAQNFPVAGDGILSLSGQIVTGILIDFAHITTQGFQRTQLSFRCFQIIQIGNVCLLSRCQLLVFRTGCFNFLLTVPGYLTDGFDQIGNPVRFCFIGLTILQSLQLLFCFYQNRQGFRGNLCFLILIQIIIGCTGCGNLGLAFQGNRFINGQDRLLNVLNLFQLLIGCFRSSQSLLQCFIHQSLLFISQCFVSSLGGIDLLFSFQGNLSDGPDFFLHQCGCIQIGILSLCIQKGLQHCFIHQSFLGICQRIVSSPGSFDCFPAVQSDCFVNSLDHFFHGIRCCLILSSLLQCCQLFLCHSQNRIIGNQDLQAVGQCIIGRPGSVDLRFALQGDFFIDGINGIHNGFCLTIILFGEDFQTDTTGCGTDFCSIVDNLLTCHRKEVGTGRQVGKRYFQTAVCVRLTQFGPGGHITGTQGIGQGVVNFGLADNRCIGTSGTHIIACTVNLQGNSLILILCTSLAVRTDDHVIKYACRIVVEVPIAEVADGDHIAVMEHNTVRGGTGGGSGIEGELVIVVVGHIAVHTPQFFHEDGAGTATYLKYRTADLIRQITLTCLFRIQSVIEDLGCVDVQVQHGGLAAVRRTGRHAVGLQSVQGQVEVRHLHRLQSHNGSGFLCLHEGSVIGQGEVYGSGLVGILRLFHHNGTLRAEVTGGNGNDRLAFCQGLYHTVIDGSNRFIGRRPGKVIILVVLQGHGCSQVQQLAGNHDRFFQIQLHFLLGFGNLQFDGVLLNLIVRLRNNTVGITQTDNQGCFAVLVPFWLYQNTSGNTAVAAICIYCLVADVCGVGCICPEICLLTMHFISSLMHQSHHLQGNGRIFVRICRQFHNIKIVGIRILYHIGFKQFSVSVYQHNLREQSGSHGSCTLCTVRLNGNTAGRCRNR